MPGCVTALELVLMGAQVRRRAWSPGEYLQRHLPAEWGGGEPPATLPSTTETVTLYTPTPADEAATDWEFA